MKTTRSLSMMTACPLRRFHKRRCTERMSLSHSFLRRALHLCRYFEDPSVELRGRRVIELGAGTGVVGILAALLRLSGCLHTHPVLSFHLRHMTLYCISGAEVTVTDLPLVLPQLQANVSANVPPAGWPSAPPVVLPLCWGEDHLTFPSDWDLVLCADIVYLPETYPLLVETLAHLCKNGAVVYLSSKMRTEHRTQSFYEEHLQSRFDVELVLRDDKQNNNIYRASKRAEE
uniref:EEF1A lysine methyltransferase 3 n=1 Tax=Xiphophorus maculatus TaxID=8083 RepID=M3ZMU8_XIPMA